MITIKAVCVRISRFSQTFLNNTELVWKKHNVYCWAIHIKLEHKLAYPVCTQAVIFSELLPWTKMWQEFQCMHICSSKDIPLSPGSSSSRPGLQSSFRSFSVSRSSFLEEDENLLAIASSGPGYDYNSGTKQSPLEASESWARWKHSMPGTWLTSFLHNIK